MMQTRSERLLEEKRPGVYSFAGTRFAFVGPEYLASITKNLERAVGHEMSRAFVYRAYKDAAMERFNRIRSSYPRGNSRTVFQNVAVDLLRTMGWCTDLEVTSYKPHRITVRVDGSFFADANRGSQNPQCHLLCGALAAISSGLLGKEYDCREITCRAKYDSICEFKIYPSLTF